MAQRNFAHGELSVRFEEGRVRVTHGRELVSYVSSRVKWVDHKDEDSCGQPTVGYAAVLGQLNVERIVCVTVDLREEYIYPPARVDVVTGNPSERGVLNVDFGVVGGRLFSVAEDGRDVDGGRVQ